MELLGQTVLVEYPLNNIKINGEPYIVKYAGVVIAIGIFQILLFLTYSHY
jgi:hypothetical protein